MNLANSNIPLLMASLAFLVICLLSIGLMIFFRGLIHRRALLEKIQSIDDRWESDAMGTPPEKPLSVLQVFLNVISTVGVKTNPNRSYEDADVRLKFARAGLRGRNVPTIFWGLKFLMAVALPLAFLVVGINFFQVTKSPAMLTVAIFASLFGLFLPDVWLWFKTKTRQEKLVKSFPDALDLMVVCVEAGMGMDATIHRVGKELGLNHPELSDEFKTMNLELRAGKSRNAAFQNLVNRTNVDDVKSLATVLMQTERFGTSVAQALRVYSDSFRTARYQRAEETAAKIATKLLFPLVVCIFPAMFIVILGPIVITIYRVMINPS